MRSAKEFSPTQVQDHVAPPIQVEFTEYQSTVYSGYDRDAEQSRLHIADQTSDSLLYAVLSVTRSEAALALVLPTVCGTALAWWQLDLLSGILFLFALLSVITMTLGFSTLSEYQNYKSCFPHSLADGNGTHPSTQSLLIHGLIEPYIVLGAGLIFLTISVLCSMWLVLLSGWPVLFFTGLSLILMWLYFIPPSPYPVLGWGMGELGIFLTYGILSVTGSYYIQSQSLTWLPIWVGIPLGLLSMLVLFSYTLLYQRRDWVLRKRTLAVTLGTKYAVSFGIVLTLLSYIAILLMVILAQLPLWILTTLLGLPLLLNAFASAYRKDEQLTIEHRFYLYKTTIRAALLTGLLFSVSLWLDRMF